MPKAQSTPKKAARGAVKGKPSGNRGFFRLLLSRPVRIIVVFAIALGLLIYFRSAVVTGLETAWGSILSLLGVGLFVVLAVLVALGWMVWRWHIPRFLMGWNRWLGALVLLLALFGLLAFFRAQGGILGEVSLGGNLGTAIVGTPGPLGALRLVGVAIVGIFLLAPGASWRAVTKSAAALADRYRKYPLHRYLGRSAVAAVASFRRRMAASRQRRPPKPVVTPVVMPVEYEAPEVAEPELVEPAVAEAEPVAEEPEPAEAIPAVAEGTRWELPSIGLLERSPEVEVAQIDTERRARLIEEALASYGVEAKVVQVNVGPTVTQFGVEPGWARKYREVKEKDRNGNVSVRLEEVSRTRVKVERITSLANDLALALAAPSIKIEAPVPGKPMVGIEVPNTTSALVSLRSGMESPQFQRLQAKSRLPLALGKGVSGETVVADLTKMPHLLIAGATGSGKSICIKSVITTLLLRATPEEVRLLLIDPKRVELVVFRDVPHLMSPVIFNWDKAVATLKWLNREMDHRYDKLAAVGARDIEGYNKNPRTVEPLPYLVLVIDELADLMAASPDEVERTLCRLAQLSRATGIHLVVATQRPSVDVVTGLIKANFPARIAFAVTAQVDSRTILDSGGAEKLLGQGDMLFLPPDASRAKRLQGSLVSDAEIERVVSFWISQRGRPLYVPQLAEEMARASSLRGGESADDPLLEMARRLATEHSHISTSFLQRRLGIGYPRAARIMDLLEEEGIVASGEPGKSRQVLKEKREAEEKW